MLIIIDKNTKKVINNMGTNSLFPDGNIPHIELKDNEEAVRIHDASDIANEIIHAYDYDLVFDGIEVSAVVVHKTLETKRNEDKLIPENILKEVRSKRDKLLQDSDFTQLPDAPFTPEQKQLWAEYRQSLRDITNGNLESIVFPDKPV